MNKQLKKIPSQRYLTLESACAYTGVQLCNCTGRTIYAMDADGNIRCLPYTRNYYFDDNSPMILERVDTRYRNEPVSGVNRYNIGDAAGRVDDVYITNLSSLYTTGNIPTAVYLKYANVAVSLVNNPELLKSVHPAFHNATMNELNRTPADVLTKVKVNLYDTTINDAYVASNAGISAVAVTHNVAEPEGISIYVRRPQGKWNRYYKFLHEIPDINCEEMAYKVTGLVIGISAEKVSAKFRELNEAKDNELDVLRRKLENTNKELELIKKDNSVLKTQLNTIINEKKEIAEIEMINMKKNIANAEYEKAKASIEADMEMLPLKNDRENQRAEYDLAVAQTKLEANMVDKRAAAWKSTAIVAASAATIGALATKVMSTSAAGVAASAASSTPVGAAVVATALVALLAYKCANGGGDGVAKLLKRTYSGLKSCGKKIVDKVGSAAKYGGKVLRKTADTIKSAGRAAWDTTKSACRKVVDTVSDIGSSMFEGIKSVGSSCAGLFGF